MLSPDEIHRLGTKTRRAVGADKGKAACHSDEADSEHAREIQRDLELPVL